MKADAELNLDSLLDAYLAKDKYKSAHEDLRGYHEKRFQILQELFGCDLARLQVRPTSRPRNAKRKATDKFSDSDGGAIVHFMENCARLLNSSKSPFRQGIYLEGRPPQLVMDLSAKYAKKLDDLEGRIDLINREVLKDVLIFFFPGIENERVRASKVYEMGLPREEPDPIDYF
jgi:hypothetical protein